MENVKRNVGALFFSLAMFFVHPAAADQTGGEQWVYPAARNSNVRLPLDVQEKMRELRESQVDRTVDKFPNGMYLAIVQPTNIIDSSSEKTVVAAMISAIEEYGGSLDQYKLNPTEFGQSNVDSKALSFRLEQSAHGNVVSSLDVSYLPPEGDREEPMFSVNGFLLNPDLPELNPSNWMSEKEALDIARMRLQDFIQDDRGREMLERATLKGELIFMPERSTDGIQVMPVLEVLENQSSVSVNLYTREVVDSTGNTLQYLSTQVLEAVCRTGLDPGYTTCDSDANQFLYPQVYKVFAEDTNTGSRICLSGSPWNLPVGTQCNTMSYQKSFDVTKEAEDYLNVSHPTLCCAYMGEKFKFFGITYRQFDINPNSNIPGYSGVAAFGLGNNPGGPNRAMIYVDSSYTNGISAKGWEKTIAHEWFHGWNWYRGNDTGLGSHNMNSKITLSSISEGLADTWAIVLNNVRFGGFWTWNIKKPNGITLRTISGSEQWSDYAHNFSDRYDNGKIFAAFYKNMETEGVSATQIRGLLVAVSHLLKYNDSGIDDGMAGTSQVNVYDFAERTRLQINAMPYSSDRTKACKAWKKFNLAPFGLQTQVCDPVTPTDNLPIFVMCEAAPNTTDPYSVWLHTWNNSEFLSWTEPHTSEDGGITYNFWNYLVNTEQQYYWAIQNLTTAEASVKLKACRWDLANSGKICATSPARPVSDICGTGAGG